MQGCEPRGKLKSWISCSRECKRMWENEPSHSEVSSHFGSWCRNPTLRKCEDETHTPELGTWESLGTPKTSEFNCKGQNTLHWGVLYIIGKLLKCRCRKWARTRHLNICNTSYGKKKGRESNLHEKSGIDLTSMCAQCVRHTVGKLLTRVTTLL